MIKRPTWIMVIVLALLAALTYYMQSVPDNFIKKAWDAGKTPTPGTSSTTLLSSTDRDISGLEIKTGDGQYSTVLKRDQTGWTVSNNAEAPGPADPNVIEQAQRLQLTGEIKPTTTDLSGFGLDKPAYIYKVTLDGGKILTFKIGKLTIMEDGYYLQKEDGTIAVVDKYDMDALIALIKQPSPILVTPSIEPVTEEVPTGTITPTPAATATPGS